MWVLHSVFGTNLGDLSLQHTPMQQVPEVGEHPPICTMVAERPVRTHISQPLTQTQPSVAGGAPEASLEKEVSGELFVLHMSPGSVHFLLGLLWVTLGDNIWVPAQKSQEAMPHQIDGLCDFSVNLSGTHLSNSLSAFNHASLHISPLELGCIALKQNGIYSGLRH